MVLDGEEPSQFIYLNANIQKIKVCLNRYSMDLGKIYAGIKQLINSRHEQCIVLNNYGNIPAKFQWNEKVVPDQLRIQFDPARGTIAPHSEFVVNMKMTTYIGGDFEEIFTCDITDFDFPLGFVCKANVFGLRVVHSLPDFLIEAQKAALAMNDFSNKTGLLTTKTLLEDKTDDGEEDDEQDKDEKNKLKALKFPSCTINKPSSQKFMLKNLSGIKTTFNFKALNYEPDDLVVPANIQGKSSLEDLPNQDGDETVTISKPGSRSTRRDTTVNVRFALTNKTKKGLKIKQLKRALLTDNHEHQNKFQSKTGETFTATKRLEREQAFYLSNNKGLAVVFEPAFGELKPHSEIPVNVTIYNNACGRFEDTFVSQIKGLPPFEFPVHVTINGSPLIIPENQVGLNYSTHPPTMAFPTVVDNSPQLTKTFKIKNTGIADVNIDWKIFDERDQGSRNEDEDLFNISIGKNTNFDSEENPFKLNFDLVEPEPSENSPYVIEPQNVIIPARETQFFEVKFNSDQGVDTFKSVVLAHPQLAKDLEVYDENDNRIEEVIKQNKPVDLYDLQSDSSDEEQYQQHSSRHQNDMQDQDQNQQMSEGNQNSENEHNSQDENDTAQRSLGIVALKLFAKTIDPVLTVDMKKKLDGEYYFNFQQWPMEHEEEPSPVQKICLVNETKANIIFNLGTEGPYKIIETKTNSGSAHPLAPIRPSSKGIKAAPLTMFSLQPDKLVQMRIEFIPPNPDIQADWPLVHHVIKKGMINVAFANGKTQHFNLVGNCVRPKVSIITMKPCKNEKGIDEVNLGEVNIERSKQTQFYLRNDTPVPAKWTLNYVKFPKKATIGYMTKTPLEIENMEKTDDPDVFQFSVTDGCLKGPSIALRVTPEGLALPSVPKDEFEKQFLPLKIMVNFRPKKNILYKSMFRFMVEKGMSYDVIFKGRGSYEEDYDDD